MRIRAEEATDIAIIHAINRAAFGSTTEANLVDALRASAAEVISLVADDDGEVVGHIMFSPVRLSEAENVQAVGLAPMAVRPTRQRTGFGSALVRAGLDECRRRRIAVVFVVGHPGYYPRFGFTRASRLGAICEFEVPDDAFMAIELTPGALPERVGTVRFHPAFQDA